MSLSVESVLIICSNGSAPLNKMAAMPIYGKKNLKISSRSKKALRLYLVLIYKSPPIFPIKFIVNCPFGSGEKKFKIDFQDGTIAAIFEFASERF